MSCNRRAPTAKVGNTASEYRSPEHPDVALKAEHAVEDRQHHRDNEADQREHPVLLAPGAAGEIGVLAKHLQIPLRDRLLSFMVAVRIEEGAGPVSTLQPMPS